MTTHDGGNARNYDCLKANTDGLGPLTEASIILYHNQAYVRDNCQDLSV